MSHYSHLVGVDEAGRGPLAGPVAVGVVAVPITFDWALIPGVGDSKQVSAKNREAIFRRARSLKRDGALNYAVSLVSASVIDGIGITSAVRLGITRGLARLNLDPADALIKLDGLLSAPPVYTHQETIVRGDETELVIGLASILAKVTRDRYMVRLGSTYPLYGFAEHKGYGTHVHQHALMKHGISGIHRTSFCRKYRKP